MDINNNEEDKEIDQILADLRVLIEEAYSQSPEIDDSPETGYAMYKRYTPIPEETTDKIIKAVQKFISQHYYTPDDKINSIIQCIPTVIENFEDCTSEEEYRMMAIRGNGTLATIRSETDPSTGWPVYNKIELDADNYKEFYYKTLSYCLLHYLFFFKDTEITITDNRNGEHGRILIDDIRLPHMLGLENRYVSEKGSALLEKIIPGYNSLTSNIDRIICIIENHKKIMEYEKENNLDIFNYYKCMQKNKEFLLFGRIFSIDEPYTSGKNKIEIYDNGNNQLYLYKKSNMNDKMRRNVCKMVIQKLDNGDYFPRSLQAVDSGILAGYYLTDAQAPSENITLDDGTIVSLNPSDYNITIEENGLRLVFPWYYHEILAPAPGDDNYEEYMKAKSMLELLGIDTSILDELDDKKQDVR